MSKPNTPAVNTPPMPNPTSNENIQASIAALDAAELERRRRADRLEELRLAREEREELEYQEKVESERKARESGIQTVKMQMEHEKLVQASCNHRKQNNQTHLGGQRLHGGKIMLVCQRCQKNFADGEIPMDLMPMSGVIGGPQF